ncbi:MAG TPA: dienelactone hydrolase family protein, partial [Chloroflexota bacterium]|nr:dienelactone hydrolase family protein [Chloroflexota bacterium]
MVDEVLDGTAPLPGGWPTRFADRYPLQHAQTITWLDRALAEAAARRDAEREPANQGLAEQRHLLSRCTGADQLSTVVEEAATLGSVGGARGYRIRTHDGLVFTGTFQMPTHGQPRAAVILAGRPAATGAVAAERYHAAGLVTIQPCLAAPIHSFSDHASRRWLHFTDDELLHLFFFIVGGSLAGLEAVELRTVARSLARRADGSALPVVFDLGGTKALPAAVAAALESDLCGLLVLHPETAAFDRQEHDARVNTIWGFHRSFDGLTLLTLAEAVPLLFVEDTTTPSPLFARSKLWLGGAPRLIERILAVAGEERATLAADIGLARWTAAPQPSITERGDERTEADLYREALESKLSYLECRHGTARTERQRRYALSELTPERYRQRVGESLERVMGPALPLAPERRCRSRLVVDRPTHAVYQVVLQSVPGIDVAGYLLVPHGTQERPTVICQHGLSGRPEYLAGLEDEWIYDRVAQRLAEKGYVTFTPFMTWGWGGTPGRDALVKRAYALGITPNRFEVAQLQAIVDFLQARPEVQSDRIAFYGLSYGGHASLWLSAHEPRLAAVITAGHFNDWQDKLTNTEITAP